MIQHYKGSQDREQVWGTTGDPHTASSPPPHPSIPHTSLLIGTTTPHSTAVEITALAPAIASCRCLSGASGRQTEEGAAPASGRDHREGKRQTRPGPDGPLVGVFSDCSRWGDSKRPAASRVAIKINTRLILEKI